MGIPFITMDAHNIVNDNVAQGCGYENRGQIVEISAEGPIVSFETNVAAPLVSLEAQIVAKQAGSGTPSPENVRPISGFDKVIITNNDIDTEIDLPETIYGGKLNVNTGKLTITHGYFNSNKVRSWSWFEPYKQAYTINFLNKVASVDSLVISDKLKGILSTDRSNNIGNFITIVNNGLDVAVSVPDINTLDDFNAWIVNNDINMIYELSEPVTVQLTPTEVNTIIGRNNISANTGDVALTYIRVNK